MKALTVWQPWASLIAIGAKPYEFRSWKPPASLVGKQLAIHAGARPVRIREVEDLLSRIEDKQDSPCLVPDLARPLLERVLAGLKTKSLPLLDEPEPFRLPLSAIVCVATVGEAKRGDACAAEFSANAGNDSDREGTFNWGWPMRDVVQCLPPHEVRGAQGLWDWWGRT